MEEKMQINMHEAKTQLSKLGKKVWQGETVVIAKSGTPYLDLVPHKIATSPRKPGSLKGKISYSEDFDHSDPDLIAMFEGEL